MQRLSVRHVRAWASLLGRGGQQAMAKSVSRQNKQFVGARLSKFDQHFNVEPQIDGTEAPIVVDQAGGI